MAPRPSTRRLSSIQLRSDLGYLLGVCWLLRDGLGSRVEWFLFILFILQKELEY